MGGFTLHAFESWLYTCINLWLSWYMYNCIHCILGLWRPHIFARHFRQGYWGEWGHFDTCHLLWIASIRLYKNAELSIMHACFGEGNYVDVQLHMFMTRLRYCSVADLCLICRTRCTLPCSRIASLFALRLRRCDCILRRKDAFRICLHACSHTLVLYCSQWWGALAIFNLYMHSPRIK